MVQLIEGCLQLMRWAQRNKRQLSFVLTNIMSKASTAFAQLYAIYVVTKIHSPDEAAVVLLLLGYATWFQVMEFGLSQTLQNKFNAREISCEDMIKTLLFQLSIVSVVATIVTTSQALTSFLLPNRDGQIGAEMVAAFSLGVGILLVASNNLITQRILLILNKGNLSNFLIMIQAVFSILGLAYYDLINEPSLTAAVFLYLAPQVIVYLPILFRLGAKLLKNPTGGSSPSVVGILGDSLAFWGLSLLSSLYLGLDYYFVAHFLNAEEVVSYHLITRLFFISYVLYYSFVYYRSKRLYTSNTEKQRELIYSTFKESVLLGILGVVFLYSVSIVLGRFGVFDSITNRSGVDVSLLSFALLYFSIRVGRDVSLVIAGALNKRKQIYIVYSIELASGLVIMASIVPDYGATGILAAMSMASMFGLLYILSQARHLSYHH